MSKVLFSLVLVGCLLSAIACESSKTTTTDPSQTKTSNLSIYLVDTGETVLSDHEIQAYRSTDNGLELNQDGIKKWNSYLPSQTPPKLEGSLFSREFVLKIDGREICRGKFWSNVSSATYSGIVILDALFPMDSSHNILWIKAGYPSTNSPLDTSVSAELTHFFE